jgi:hypothetical protein
MGLFANLISKWATGKTADQLQAERDAADAKLAELNQAKLDSGSWSKRQFDLAESDRLASYYDVSGEIYAAAQEGALEGLAAEKQLVSRTGTTIIKEALSWIPWWGWLGLAIYVGWQLGWLRWLWGKARA